MEDHNIMDEHYNLDTAEIGVLSSLRDRVIIDISHRALNDLLGVGKEAHQDGIKFQRSDLINIEDRLHELYHFDKVVDSSKNLVDQVEG